MRVLIVSGIWPPDVGGPASHAPEVADFLQKRGHSVEVVTTASSQPAPEKAYDVKWVSRRWPIGVRHALGVALVGRRATAADVVYTTGLFGRSALGSRLARTPYVLKLTSDPAHERSLRRGLASANLEEFQQAPGGLAIRSLRGLRDAELRGAARIFCPSGHLRALVVSWGIDPALVEVLPNPLPVFTDLPTRDEARRRLSIEGATLVYAGRLTRQKSLTTALEALAATEGVTLLLAGEGDDRTALEDQAAALGLDGRVRFLGPQPRETVLELFRAADALLLTSSWENFPHTVVEALAVGTPVLATAAGGVVEIVEDGRNGLLVPPGDARALAETIDRFFGDGQLQASLRAAAGPSVTRYAPERIYSRLEEALREVAGR